MEAPERPARRRPSTTLASGTPSTCWSSAAASPAAASPATRPCAGSKVALVEKNDFAAGTSSKSSKLMHGGLRYLEQAELRPGLRVGQRAEAADAPGAPPGAPAARSWCRTTGRPRAGCRRSTWACGSTTRCAASRSFKNHRTYRAQEDARARAHPAPARG